MTGAELRGAEQRGPDRLSLQQSLGKFVVDLV